MRELLLLLLVALASAEVAEEASTLPNPEEGDLFEGDMELTYNPFVRNMKLSESYRWPNGIVYYEIVTSGFSSRDLDNINKAIAQYHSKTCIKWVKKTTQDYWVQISRSSAGCFATVGRVSRSNRSQRINLGVGCTSRVGTIVHEMMHAIGFHHEQSRPDRDSFVTIQTANIQSGKEGNFRKYSTSQVTTLNLPYDYGSVMHYNAYAFSKNRQKTIVPKKAGATIGQRNGLSDLDVKKINALYKCSGQTGTTSRPGSTAKPVTTQAPKTQTTFICNFDKDMCGFTQSRTDTLDWTRKSGATASSSTGPTTDHTSGKGYYVYVEASSRKAGDKADIVSPSISVTPGQYAIRFSYHMYGANMGSLQAYMLLGSRKQVIQTISGNKGNKWNSFCTTMTVSGSGSMKIGFTGTVGSSFHSDIAIDDVSILKGQCPGQVATTQAPKTGSSKTLFSCTFSSGTCGMSLQGNGLAWTVHTGSTPSVNTGPTSDAKGASSGKYLYTEASGKAVGSKAAAMTSYIKPASGTACLDFYYHMYGAAAGTFNLYYQVQGSSTNYRMYTKIGDQGNSWKRVRMNVGTISTNTRFVFEAIRGSSYTSDLAIDEINITDGRC